MSQQQKALQGTVRAVLTERFSLWGVLRAVGPVCRAVAIEPKAFFGAIGKETRLSVGNALLFLAVSLSLYVVVQILFEQFLIQFAGYDAQPLISYYATWFEEQELPVPNAFGILAAAAHAVLASLLVVIYYTVTVWVFAHAFIHVGQISSLQALFVAGLYAVGSIVLTFCFLSLPAAYLDSHEAGPVASDLETKYEAIFAYMYLRSISFTSDLRLHWGLVFSVLLLYGVTLVTRGF